MNPLIDCGSLSNNDILRLAKAFRREIDMLLAPVGDFGGDPIADRDEFLLRAFSQHCGGPD